MNCKEETDKTRRILNAVRGEILSGKLRPGDRVKSVRTLAAEFSVSQRPAQCALNVLAEEGLIELRRGSGTFVKATVSATDDTIYFLVPSPSHLASDHESAVAMRRIFYGATLATKPGQLAQQMPVCKENVSSLKRSSEAIDWATLDRIPQGGNVFVGAAWYGPVISQLVKRGVHGVFLSHQNEKDFPETMGEVNEAGWTVFTLDRRGSARRVLGYLSELGKRRIAAIKSFKNQPCHPFRLGFFEGCEENGLSSSEDAFLEIDPRWTEARLRESVFSLWKKMAFDALVVLDPHTIGVISDIVQRDIGAAIPDEIALIAYRDMPALLDLKPRISSFDFFWRDIGREAVEVVNDANLRGTNIRFQASIIERTSANSGTMNSSINMFLPDASWTDESFLEEWA